MKDENQNKRTILVNGKKLIEEVFTGDEEIDEEDFEEMLKDEVIEWDVKEMNEIEALFDEETKKIIAEFHNYPTEENLIRAAEAGAKAEERIRAAANR